MASTTPTPAPTRNKEHNLNHINKQITEAESCSMKVTG